MKSKLYEQRESPRKTAAALIKDFAFQTGVGESTLPAMPLGTVDGPGAFGGARRLVETIPGDFGYHTLSSTVKAKSLFKNHMHKHIDQVDGNSFADRLIRPGDPIRHKVQHDH